MEEIDAYKDFTMRLNLLISKQPDLITTTLSNIFTMRLVGNKTHGDLAEIALVKLFSHALVASAQGHKTAIEKMKEDIILLKQQAGLTR